jgi:hypothetical protein
MPDVKDDLVTFLRSNFDDTAPSVDWTNDDDIVFADYDGARSYPEVAVVSRDPIVPGGGTTGATGIDAGGGGPVQDVVYLVLVDCWGGPHDADAYSGSATDPDSVAVELAEEVASTCRQGSDGAPSGYEWIMADPPQEADDIEENPTHHREQVQVRMKWTYTP